MIFSYQYRFVLCYTVYVTFDTAVRSKAAGGY